MESNQANARFTPSRIIYTLLGLAILVVIATLLLNLKSDRFLTSKQSSLSNAELGAEQEDNPVLEQAAPDTGKWQTYTNTKLGFSFQYPTEFKLVENVKDLPYLDQNADVALIQNTSDGTVGDYLTFKAVRSSLKAAIADNFDWRLTEMRFGRLETGLAYMMDYNTASAKDIARTYILTKTGPSAPDDNGQLVTNIILAKIRATVENPVERVTLGDQIIGTVKFDNK